jgi:hypothetical protein
MWDSPIGLKTVHFWYALPPASSIPPCPALPCLPLHTCNAMLTQSTTVGPP